MRTISVIFIVVLFASCGSGDKQTANFGTTTQTKVEVASPDSTVAIRFLNEYLENGRMSPDDLQKWLGSVTTKHFITEYNRITEDDELDFDPILAAQDAPVKFELESFDPQTGYVIARGVDWEDFKVVLRIVNENNGWLVDGSGEVNIPDEKQIH